MFYFCFSDSTAMILFRFRTNKCGVIAIFAVALKVFIQFVPKRKFVEIDRLFCGYAVRASVPQFNGFFFLRNLRNLAEVLIGIYLVLFVFLCPFFQIRAVSLARTKVLEINELRVHRAMVNQRVCVPYWMKNNCKP